MRRHGCTPSRGACCKVIWYYKGSKGLSYVMSYLPEKPSNFTIFQIFLQTYLNITQVLTPQSVFPFCTYPFCPYTKLLILLYECGWTDKPQFFCYILFPIMSNNNYIELTVPVMYLLILLFIYFSFLYSNNCSKLTRIFSIAAQWWVLDGNSCESVKFWGVTMIRGLPCYRTL